MLNGRVGKGVGTGLQRENSLVRRAHVFLQHGPIGGRVGTAHAWRHGLARPCQRLCPPYESR
jgi:hypothetical protein